MAEAARVGTARTAAAKGGARGLRRGAADGRLVQDAAAVGAHLLLHLVRDACPLTQHVQVRRDVLVGSDRLLLHRSSQCGPRNASHILRKGDEAVTSWDALGERK